MCQNIPYNLHSVIFFQKYCVRLTWQKCKQLCLLRLLLFVIFNWIPNCVSIIFFSVSPNFVVFKCFQINHQCKIIIIEKRQHCHSFIFSSIVKWMHVCASFLVDCVQIILIHRFLVVDYSNFISFNLPPPQAHKGFSGRLKECG